MPRLGTALRRHLAGLRILLVLTVLTGVAYPAAVTALAQLPGLRHQAQGSLVRTGTGTVVGSALVGQSFTDGEGDPLPRYFQTRPSAAGDGYDPTASSASNLGPESIVDTLPQPGQPDSGSSSLLTQVCGRSLAVGRLEHVDGSRPYCTASGVGAVLGVLWSGPGFAGRVSRVVSMDEQCPARPFVASYAGVPVTCARAGEDLSAAQVVPVRGAAPAQPAVPADAVTASGSGLDPDISPAYAALQVPRVAAARHLPVTTVRRLVAKATTGRGLGFLGEPVVDVVTLDLALDRLAPGPHS